MFICLRAIFLCLRYSLCQFITLFHLADYSDPEKILFNSSDSLTAPAKIDFAIQHRLKDDQLLLLVKPTNNRLKDCKWVPAKDVLKSKTVVKYLKDIQNPDNVQLYNIIEGISSIGTNIM